MQVSASSLLPQQGKSYKHLFLSLFLHSLMNIRYQCLSSGWVSSRCRAKARQALFYFYLSSCESESGPQRKQWVLWLAAKTSVGFPDAHCLVTSSGFTWRLLFSFISMKPDVFEELRAHANIKLQMFAQLFLFSAGEKNIILLYFVLNISVPAIKHTPADINTV